MTYYGALDVGGTKTICSVADDSYHILIKEQFPTVRSDPEVFFASLSEKLGEQCRKLGITFADLGGIGVTLPGMTDENGILLLAPFLKWRNVDVASIIGKHTGVEHVRCACDVNACALAEYRLGGGTERDFLWITVSTGIGGAFILDGKLLYGVNAVAGEIGHTKVEYHHPARCSCGGLGCAEAHASGTALTREVLFACEKDSELNALFEERGLSKDAAGASVLAGEGNAECLALFDLVGDYLGRAIANAVNLTDVGCVYIGGGMSRSFDLLLPSIRRRLGSDAIEYVRNVKILPTALGYEAALLGAVTLAGLK